MPVIATYWQNITAQGSYPIVMACGRFLRNKKLAIKLSRPVCWGLKQRFCVVHPPGRGMYPKLGMNSIHFCAI